jgi:hypothetical protein
VEIRFTAMHVRCRFQNDKAMHDPCCWNKVKPYYPKLYTANVFHQACLISDKKVWSNACKVEMKVTAKIDDIPNNQLI